MATAGVTAQQVPSGADKHLGTTQAHGLTTPKGTPEPDAGRIEANQVRLQKESQNANAQQHPPNEESQPRPESQPNDNEAGEEDEEDEEDDEDEAGEGKEYNRSPTQEQLDAVEKVMSLKPKAFHKILGVEKTYPTPLEKRQKVRDAFRSLGCLTHEKYNNAEDAKEAFSRVIKAARKLEIEDHDIKKMKDWDGEEKILDVPLNESDESMPKTNEVPTEKTQTTDKAGNDGGMDEEKTLQEPTLWHRQVQQACTSFLTVLLDDPENAEAISRLDDANNAIRTENQKNRVQEDQFLINYSALTPLFKDALPYRARFKANPMDQEARSKIDSINAELSRLNKANHHPDDWLIVYTAPPPASETRNQRPPPSPAPARKQTASQTQGSTGTKDRTARKPKFLTITEREGYVLDRGIEKEIAGYMPAGWGHQVLLRHDGKNDLDIHELVRASKFGKKFIEKNTDVLKGKEINLGSKESLKGKKLSGARVGGVASVRRYPTNEPMDGWEREAKTIVLLSFGTSSRSTWYLRSVLGQEFGQEKVDEEVVNRYRKRVGQKRPLGPTKRGTRKKRKDRDRVASDDEDEGSISVEEEDTSGEEDGEVEDAEDYEDDGDVDEDQAEMELLMEHLKKLKKRMGKKQGKAGDEGSTSSQKTKAKKSKAK